MVKRIVATGVLSALFLVGIPTAAFADGHHHHGYRQGYHQGYHRGYEHGYHRGYRSGYDHGYWHGRDWDHRDYRWNNWNWDEQCQWAWYNDPAWYSNYCA